MESWEDKYDRAETSTGNSRNKSRLWEGTDWSKEEDIMYHEMIAREKKKRHAVVREEEEEARRIEEWPWEEERAPVIGEYRPWPSQRENHDQEKAEEVRARAIPPPPADNSTGRGKSKYPGRSRKMATGQDGKSEGNASQLGSSEWALDIKEKFAELTDTQVTAALQSGELGFSPLVQWSLSRTAQQPEQITAKRVPTEEKRGFNRGERREHEDEWEEPTLKRIRKVFNSPHLLGDPARVTTDGRSLGETLLAMIPGVGGFWQLFSSPHLYKPISTALRHLGKRDTSTIQPTMTPEEWTIQPTRTPEQNMTQTEEWNRIHSGTCETHKDCADISFCSENHTCLPQGKFIMGCIAVVVIIGSGITACIWCPFPGRMGR